MPRYFNAAGTGWDVVAITLRRVGYSGRNDALLPWIEVLGRRGCRPY